MGERPLQLTAMDVQICLAGVFAVAGAPAGVAGAVCPGAVWGAAAGIMVVFSVAAIELLTTTKALTGICDWPWPPKASRAGEKI